MRRFPLDDTELTEDIQPRSPDFSVVSEADQRFYQELQQYRRSNIKRGYISDGDSNTIRVVGSSRREALKLAREENNGSDRMFFQLYTRVVEQPEMDEDN